MPTPPILRPLLTPVSIAFVGSLLLSLVAVLSSTLNRDGMLYVNTAQAFLDGGFSAAKENFAWPFLSVFMALLSTLSGLSLENAGHAMNALFMASTCALMVSCVARRQPEIAWAACLVILAIPGLNEYRHELLREYGCWFFTTLAFWLALRWSNRPSWHTTFLVQTSLGTAALFRPEALALFPALIAWQILDAPKSERWKRLAMFGALPAMGGVLLIGLYAGGHLASGDRLASDLGRLNIDRFDAKAEALAASLIEYARGQAQTILLFGSLALVPIKLIQKEGLFLIPLAVLFLSRKTRLLDGRFSLFAWAIAAHLLVLAVFVTDLQFLAGRYVGLILLFSVPFVALGLSLMQQRWPRCRWVIVLLACAMMLANVISAGPGKKHFVDAGKWLAENSTQSQRVYIDSGRAAFHAGWKNPHLQKRDDRRAIELAVTEGRYDLFVLEVSRDDPPVENWLKDLGLEVVKRFELRNKDAVIIAISNKGKP